jgi:hypothetical protein
MPRPLRDDYAGEVYHALNRGNARKKYSLRMGTTKRLNGWSGKVWRNIQSICFVING